ncbi:MAG: Dyp-type peroxidase [Chloroflexi bacterium]|nr:Dyp-type peroxidase [Chloroflexota bacterium]OJW02614.1 MAG: hypothetical protein BGO39_08705 [Chloroflexi bacterium 54-19]
MSEISRRSALKALGLATASAVVGSSTLKDNLLGGESLSQVFPQIPAEDNLFPFEGVHQAGILTDPPDAILVASLQVIPTTLDGLVQIMKILTERIRALMAGQLGPVVDESDQFPPKNTGDMGYDQLNEGHLTILVGLGSSLFIQGGQDRFGLAAKKPLALKPMPRDLIGDKLNPDLLDGDILLEISSDHPLENMHALRDILRNTKGLLSPLWMQPGFQRHQKNVPVGQANVRTVLGFKDGTTNLDVNNDDLMNTMVWTGTEEPSWAQGGTYMALRLIRESIEHWDRQSLESQQNSIGRYKVSGASLDNITEVQLPDYADDPDGNTVPLDAHIRKANPRLGPESEKRRILRRGYMYLNGFDKSGLLDGGAIFHAFCRNVEEQFEYIKRNYMTNRNFPKTNTGVQDLDEYMFAVGGGYFFIPAGVQSDGRFLADALLLG